MAERTIGWKPRAENRIMGTRVDRVDGVEKASGSAKYAADFNTPGTLYALALTFKGGTGKVKHLDVEPAKKVPGVRAVKIVSDVGAELRWDGALVAVVAAERLEQAEDGIRAIAVEFEPLPHFVDESDLEGAKKAERTKELREQNTGDVDAAMKDAKITHKGFYGIHTISHMCMEPHGSHAEWSADGKLNAALSTQNVSGTAGQYAGPLGVDAASVRIHCDYIGGGFGSKFQVDEWDLIAAQLAKETGRPVRFLLDRATELKIAGTRPSGFIEVTVGADSEGKILAWDSHHWGSDGMGGGTIGSNVIPYVFEWKNRRRKATGLITNAGPIRAWRAPNHPQACALTDTVLDDLAAKLGLDSYDVFSKNLDQTDRAELYAAQMKIGADLIGWKEKWHAHGKGTAKGPVKQGLGMAIHTWGGQAHAGKCNVKVHQDGSVESISGSQDLGTGTRTAIGIVLAETFGIPLSLVNVKLGSNQYPASGPSGGSTTIGGVSGPNRRAALEALWKIYDLVAKKYGVPADSLAAVDGNIVSNGTHVCSWQQACHLIGPMSLEVQGVGPANDGLTKVGVGGIQMADVSVDTETGKIRINKFVAVQDTGTIINLKCAESQVYGALIMGICYALSEERIMDNKTGRFINSDLENYKLARIGDIGELVVEMYQPDDEYARGVIGLGEPPVIGCGAALSNAVANAIGVRVPVLPMTPQRVLEALKGGAA